MREYYKRRYHDDPHCGDCLYLRGADRDHYCGRDDGFIYSREGEAFRSERCLTDGDKARKGDPFWKLLDEKYGGDIHLAIEEMVRVHRWSENNFIEVGVAKGIVDMAFEGNNKAFQIHLGILSKQYHAEKEFDDLYLDIARPIWDKLYGDFGICYKCEEAMVLSGDGNVEYKCRLDPLPGGAHCIRSGIVKEVEGLIGGIAGILRTLW